MIEISHLTKKFNDKSGEVTALHDVNLSIGRGDVFGIIGMSRAGKSPLPPCLSSLEAPTSGTVTLDCVNLHTLSGSDLIRMRRRMGVVFQGYNLLMQRTVRQNVAFPLSLAGGDPAETARRTSELLELVGLSAKADSYPSQLSGGQKQRVAIARALSTSPEVLLCDEPTSALDSLTTKSVLELLRDINRKLNVTIVIITHEIAVVKAICNKVAVIDASEFVEWGDTQEIFAAPKSRMTRQLLGYEVMNDD